jgi:uncharacterized membrane protein
MLRRFDAAVLGCHRDLANEGRAAVETVVDVMEEICRLDDIAEVLVVACTAVLDTTLDISELGCTLVVITLVALSLDVVIATDTVLLIILNAVVVVVLIQVTNWPPNRVSLHP